MVKRYWVGGGDGGGLQDFSVSLSPFGLGWTGLGLGLGGLGPGFDNKREQRKQKIQHFNNVNGLLYNFTELILIGNI